jgi:hypothetical protein
LTFVVFYVFFGIFVAWQNPAFNIYYGDLISSMAEVGGLMLLLQAARGLLFIVISYPLLHNMTAPVWKRALAFGFMFSMLTAANLLIPTSIMPDTVRMSHFIEVAVPAVLFGILFAWLMNRQHRSVRELLGREDEAIAPKQEIVQDVVVSLEKT